MNETNYKRALYEPKYRVMETQYDSYCHRIERQQERIKLGSTVNNLNNTEKKFAEFKENYNLLVTTFEEKVAFMIKFHKYLEEEERKEQIETLKDERKKLIEAAKERYNSKSSLWKLFNKKRNPEKIDFDNIPNEKIVKLYTKKAF